MELKVIDGDERPEDWAQCPKCNGVVFIELRQMIRRTKKGTTAGMKAKACAVCFVKGELVMV